MKDARDAVLEAVEPLVEDNEELIEVVYVAVTRKRDQLDQDKFHVATGSCLEVPSIIREEALKAALELV